MKKWNGKKRIGRKARAMRAGLRALPPGLYAFQIEAVRMMESGKAMQLTFTNLARASHEFGKTVNKRLLNEQYGKLSTRVKL